MPIDSNHGIYRDLSVWAERRPALAQAVMAPLICWSSGPRVERNLLIKRVRMSGFLVFDYRHRDEEAIARGYQIAWARDASAIAKISSMASKTAPVRSPDYRGDNLGKRLIRLKGCGTIDGPTRSLSSERGDPVSRSVFRGDRLAA